MFRLTQYRHELLAPTPVRRRAGPVKPVALWNLTRRCNLRCRRCYTTSADVPFPGAITHDQAMGVLDDLHGLGIPPLILSGGEPLSRFDFFAPAERARALGFRHLSLSTNVTKVAEHIERIADLAFDCVGISLDGIRALQLNGDPRTGQDRSPYRIHPRRRPCAGIGLGTGRRGDRP